MPKTPIKIDAWWFAAGNKLPHGDNRKIIVGKKHSLRGDIMICAHALHASRDPFDALFYAPGPILYRVRCWGDVIEQGDKLGARNREYVAMRDATDMLRQFARERALSVIHLWDAPLVVKEYLETGDEALRNAAAHAADAAADAADAAAYSAYAAYSTDAATGAARAAIGATRAAARAARAARAAARAADAADAAARAADAADAAAQKRFNELVAELFSTVE